MRSKAITVAILIILMLCECSFVFADSIWAKRDKNMRNMYVDDVARQIGDILTVRIAEDSKVDNKAKRDLKKETDRSVSFNGELGIDHILPSMPGIEMSAESSNELKGKADFKDERSYTDSVSVVVVDIQPNGNLVIMGMRDRIIAGDTQSIEVSGIVRPSDIEYNNTIKSEQIANFRVVTKNAGVAEPYNRQGWLGRLFDLLWPF